MFAVWFARCVAGVVLAVLLGAPLPGMADVGETGMRVHDAAAPAPISAALAGRTFAAGVPSNITTADPPVARPDTVPCTVTLFNHVAFEDFNPKPFAFAPPSACRGPWAKVVLTVDLSVTPGTQFDRTATIGLGGATIFFGTTAEPFSNEGPAWTVYRDVTDLSALFTGPRTGQIFIANAHFAPYLAVIYGTAKLSFYPCDKANPAPRVADIVVPLADPAGNPVALTAPTSMLVKSFTPPKNVETAYLDVIAQSQHNDEFWYTCVPNDLAGPLNDCGNTAFRETDAFVDGKPAGVAPVYPWIYTGGIDPFLWAPTPGVQTLNFVPYRVDLTPFAATFDSGSAHTVALSEFNSFNYFSVTANLLLFLDRGAKGPLTGGLDADTLAATPPERVTETGTFTPDGTVVTTSKRCFRIAGHLNTSHGTVRTQVDQDLRFVQSDAIVNAAAEFAQNITQDERVRSLTTTSGSSPRRFEQAFDYPLQLTYDYRVDPDKTSQQVTTVRQGYVAATSVRGSGRPPYWSFVSNTVTPKDTLLFDAGGNFTGFAGNASSQLYIARDSHGLCYGRMIESKSLIVTSATNVPCGTDL